MTRFLTISAALFCVVAAKLPHAQAAQPNFVVFLVDDLGWGAMSSYGHPCHETPNFDELCSRGMRFTDAYAACTVCSPSRAALLTGRYPARLHLTDWIAGHERKGAPLNIPDWKRQIDRDLTTLPEALVAQGYRTAFLGKWHLMPIYKQWNQQRTLREQALHTPEEHGFGVNIGGREWGMPNGPAGYFAPFNMPGLEEAPEGEYLTDRLTDEACRLLEGFGDDPFFLYLSYYTVHTPIQAKPQDVAYFKSKYCSLPNPPKDLHQAATYAAMHRSLDQSVGRVIDKLAAVGKSQDTIVIFTGDNGGDRHDACGGLRGRKALAFEGGVREPTCVVWPGVVEPGSVCSTPVIGNDFYPTMLAMAGLDALPQQHLDGLDLSPLLRQTGGVNRDSLYWHYPHYHRTTPYGAVRRGDLKLIEFYEDDRLMLFNLADDLHEENDLSQSKPELAAELLAQLKAWRQEVGAQMPTENK